MRQEGGCDFNGVVREGLTGRVTFEQGPERGREEPRGLERDGSSKAQEAEACWVLEEGQGSRAVEAEKASEGKRRGDGTEREMKPNYVDRGAPLSLSSFFTPSEVGTIGKSVQRTVRI